MIIKTDNQERIFKNILYCLHNKIPFVVLDDRVHKNKKYLKDESLDLDSYENYKLDDADLKCYTCYSSGTTGEPKEININRSNFYNYDNFIKSLVENRNYKIMNCSPFYFDNSYFSISLFNNTRHLKSEIFLYSSDKIFNIKNFINFINNNKITDCLFTPTVFSLILKFKHLLKNKFNTIYFCGENLETDMVKLIFDLGLADKVYNLYGPTEITGFCFYKLFTKNNFTNPKYSETFLPIGNPIFNADYLIKDNELLISSKSCFSGYNRDEFDYINNKKYFKTRDLVQIKNNEIYVLGRKDNKIKLNGCLIDLNMVSLLLYNNKIKNKIFIENNYIKINYYNSNEEKLLKVLDSLPNYYKFKLEKRKLEEGINRNGKIK